MKLSVIIPVYNEEKTLPEIIQRVKTVTIPAEKEIIIVDDCSTDRCREFLLGLNDPEIKVVLHKKNQGKGAALRTGFQMAAGDIVLIQDADLEYDPKDYPRLLEPIIHGQAEVVYGCRFSQGLKIEQVTRQHRKSHPWHVFYYLGNRFLSLVTALLYGTAITDMETGYKVFKSSVIKNLKLNANRFDFEPEVTSKILKKGIKILEVPIAYEGREYDEGKKITWRDGLAAIKTLVKYRFFD